MRHRWIVAGIAITGSFLLVEYLIRKAWNVKNPSRLDTVLGAFCSMLGFVLVGIILWAAEVF